MDCLQDALNQLRILRKYSTHTAEFRLSPGKVKVEYSPVKVKVIPPVKVNFDWKSESGEEMHLETIVT